MEMAEKQPHTHTAEGNNTAKYRITREWIVLSITGTKHKSLPTTHAPSKLQGNTLLLIILSMWLINISCYSAETFVCLLLWHECHQWKRFLVSSCQWFPPLLKPQLVFHFLSAEHSYTRLRCESLDHARARALTNTAGVASVQNNVATASCGRLCAILSHVSHQTCSSASVSLSEIYRLIILFNIDSFPHREIILEQLESNLSHSMAPQAGGGEERDATVLRYSQSSGLTRQKVWRI